MTHKPSAAIQQANHATIEWDEQGLPIAKTFGDAYFSPCGGLNEIRHVYLEQNQLPSRWAALSTQQTFIIAETGFGTGLNFLACWQLWQQQKQAGLVASDAHLHFISVERHPLLPQDLTRALALWPELHKHSDALLAQYPSASSQGFHRLNFDDVSLTLIIDEVVDGLEQLQCSDHPLFSQPQWRVDAWFLDGFSPIKNPDMWRLELFQQIQKLSGNGTSATSSTSTHAIKEHFQSCGFSVEAVLSFDARTEMLRAKLEQPYVAPAAEQFGEHSHNAEHNAPWHVAAPTEQQRRQALIIGGGLAGCHTANALAQRGWQVTLLEQHPKVASEGSGNPQGVLYAKLSAKDETLGDFNRDALQFAQRHYARYWETDQPTQNEANLGQRCGVLQLSYNDKVKAQHQRLLESYQSRYPQQQLIQALDSDTATHVSGLVQPSGGVFFPDAGWINPQRLCQRLLAHPNITLRTSTCVEAISHDGQQWRVAIEDQGQAEQHTTVIVCCASHVSRFTQTDHLPVKAIRGQVTYSAATPASLALKTVLCADGYVAPAAPVTNNNTFQQHCFGASFSLHNPSLAFCPNEQRDNRLRLARHFPSLAKALAFNLDDHTASGRVARRCTTPDYLPIVGPAPNFDAYIEQFALLRKNARAGIPRAGPNWPNLYLNIGYGSRGLTYSPLCAELLAAQIDGAPLPLPRNVKVALHPARFIIRGLIRKKL